MKAKLYDQIKILMDVPADFSDRIVLKDTVVYISLYFGEASSALIYP